MSNKNCPNCGKPIIPDARYCTHCGHPLTSSLSKSEFDLGKIDALHEMRSDTLKVLLLYLSIGSLGLWAFIDNIVNRAVSNNLSRLETRIENERQTLLDEISDAQKQKKNLQSELDRLKQEGLKITDTETRLSSDLKSLQPKKTEVEHILEDSTLLSALHKLRYDHTVIRNLELRMSMGETPEMARLGVPLPISTIGFKRKSELVVQFNQLNETTEMRGNAANSVPYLILPYQMFRPFEARIVGAPISALADIDIIEIVYGIKDGEVDKYIEAINSPRKFEISLYLNQVPLMIIAADQPKFEVVPGPFSGMKLAVARISVDKYLHDPYRLYADRIKELTKDQK
jgi:hypothetical protein